MRIPPHQRFTLANGLRLIALPRHDVPLVAFEAVVRGGARMDQPGRAGLASLTAELLTRGAGGRDAGAFAEAVEDAGGSFDADAGSEAIVLHGQFLAPDLELLLGLLADALLRPRFEAAELENIRARRIQFIKAAKDSDPQSLIGRYARALLFAGHPFASPVSGSETSLANLTREQVTGLYRRQFGADRITLVFSGDFDPAWLRQAVAAAFRQWRPAESPLGALPEPQRANGRCVLLIDAPDAAQSYFWIGNVGVARGYAPRAALDITNTAFGGSFSSMLMQALRTTTGLSYAASSSFRRGSVAGEFSISSFTPTDSTLQALELTLGTLQRLKREGLANAAIDSARSYILGQYPLAFETAADWAAALADLDLYGLPDSYIDEYDAALGRVCPEDTRAVIAEAFPSSADARIVAIGDARRIGGSLSRLGPVRVKSLSAPDFEPPSV